MRVPAKRDLLSLAGCSKEEVLHILRLSKEVKSLPGNFSESLKGKAVAMIFEKPSTRTRVSFETGVYQLGGLALYISSRDLQIGRGETLADTARTLSSYVQAVVARVFSHKTLEELAENASIPIINGLSDRYHPCQALADLLTLMERSGELEGFPLAYVGDGNNVAHSLMLGGAIMGMDVRIATPPDYAPLTVVKEQAAGLARRYGARVALFTDPSEAIRGVRAVYTDVWASMGQEEERERRLRDFKGWTVTDKMMESALPDAVFMHCLPAHRGEEVAPEVIDSERSIVWEQAENRLHTGKGLLIHLLSGVQ